MICLPLIGLTIAQISLILLRTHPLLITCSLLVMILNVIYLRLVSVCFVHISTQRLFHRVTKFCLHSSTQLLSPVRQLRLINNTNINYDKFLFSWKTSSSFTINQITKMKKKVDPCFPFVCKSHLHLKATWFQVYYCS